MSVDVPCATSPHVAGSHIGFGVGQRLSSLRSAWPWTEWPPRAPARDSSASGRRTRGRRRRYLSISSRPRRWCCRSEWRCESDFGRALDRRAVHQREERERRDPVLQEGVRRREVDPRATHAARWPPKRRGEKARRTSGTTLMIRCPRLSGSLSNSTSTGLICVQWCTGCSGPRAKRRMLSRRAGFDLAGPSSATSRTWRARRSAWRLSFTTVRDDVRGDCPGRGPFGCCGAPAREPCSATRPRSGADARPFSVLGFTIAGGRIVEINILADPQRLAVGSIGPRSRAENE